LFFEKLYPTEKKMRVNKTIVALIISAAFLSGCSSTDEKDGSLLDGGKNGDIDASTSGVSDGSSLSGQQFGENALGSEFNDPSNPLSKQTIYFMYDSSQIQQEFIPVVAAHAQYLISHPSQKVILEGHADERGSREYNIALGEQRGKSVYRMMKIQGVSDSQLEIVSYGEEKPVADGMDEYSWQQNRRVEIAYQGQ
jgi:peptidoglycan-associated lipoprotein